jgi:predicted signal transduction protein with EAL and GGDEF domain
LQAPVGLVQAGTDGEIALINPISAQLLMMPLSPDGDLASLFTALEGISGEAFAVLLPSTGLSGAAAVAERLRALVAASCVTVDGASIHYTVSAGVTEMGDSAGALDGLRERAGLALYAAAGR